MLQFFARVGYVPYLEELLSMGADPASKVAPLSRARGRVRGWRCRAEGDGDGEAMKREAGCGGNDRACVGTMGV